MSILIKGMEMPKHGEGVCLIVANFESCGSPVAMLVDRESILPKDFYDAIEIPTPHGRLIDADKLVWFIDNHIASGKKWVEFETIKDMINSLPTIIEAEIAYE